MCFVLFGFVLFFPVAGHIEGRACSSRNRAVRAPLTKCIPEFRIQDDRPATQNPGPATISPGQFSKR